jgi:hypothetical protein
VQKAKVTALLSDEFHTRFKTPGARRATLRSGSAPPTSVEETFMPKFVIEREIPGAGKLSPRDLKAISKKSCGVLSSLGPSVQWIESYVTADKIYCVYIAADESLVRRHAELGGFPANKISAVATVIDPTTAE